MDDILESDRLLDLPHPRETADFTGNEAAEAKLLQAYRSGKMHHGWIIGGPRGIGKATLAYRLARFVLRHPDPAEVPHDVASLAVDPDDTVFRRIAAGAHPDLFVARREYDRKSKRLKRDITAETVRNISHFFERTSGAGGWRVCIVDAADDMNRSAANALLKVLEEPPARSLFLLVTHSPQRLIATVRSRCIGLNLKPLDAGDLDAVLSRLVDERERPKGAAAQELLALCQGSPGQALSLIKGNGLDLFARFRGLLAETEKSRGPAALGFAETVGARGAEADYAQFCDLLLDWLADRTRHAALDEQNGPGSSRALAEAWQQIARSLDRANALNLDRKQTILQTLRVIEATGAQAMLRS